MPRKKVKWIKLYTRVSENNMTDEELEFVEDRLQYVSKSEFMRKAIKVYYKYVEENLIDKEEFLDEVIEGLKEYNSFEEIKDDEELYGKLDEKFENGFLE